MEKERLIVVALGNLYVENKKVIEDNFKVVALADNDTSKLVNRNDGFKYIRISDIRDEKFDKILICTESHYTSLKIQLLQEGIDPDKIYSLDLLESIKWPKDYQKYLADCIQYKELQQKYFLDKFVFKEQYPVLSDYRKAAGEIDSHYFYQDIIVASKIIKKHPNCHVDVGSRIDGFISHLLAAGVETTVIDIRPLTTYDIGEELEIPKLNFIQADAVNLDGIDNCSIKSLSSLHAIEHFGLGRYGDKVNPLSCFDAMHSLERVLANGGILYLSVPVGIEEKLMFNAHRIFSPSTIIESMAKLQLIELYIIHDGAISRYREEDILKQSYIACLGAYNCGIFIFKK